MRRSAETDQTSPAPGLAADGDEPLLVIDAQELYEDRRDGEWQSFLRRAKAHRERLRSEGRLRQ